MGQHNVDPAHFFAESKNKKVLVVGDYIVDQYRFLSPKALSPEAPIVCFQPISSEYRHGGAGNVVENLLGIGVPAGFLTVIGDDYKRGLPGVCWAVREAGRKTTVKERLLTRRQQIARIDIQSNTRIKTSSATSLVSYFLRNMSEPDAIIFSDYDHGCMIPELVRPIMEFAIRHGIPTVVDSKAKDTLVKYKGCTVAIPNMDEARKILGLELSEEETARTLRQELGARAVAVTLGPKGILLDEGIGAQRRFPAINGEDEVVDVTGAGDTVAAIVGTGLAARFSLDSIMVLANFAAGVKVHKLGVAPVTPSEIETLYNSEEKRGRQE